MDTASIWNMVLTGLIAIIGFMVQNKMGHLDNLTKLVNRTREEIARDHVTRAEMNTTVDRLGERFDKAFERLEAKLDEIGKR
jgi:hypothetical protein